MSDPLPPELSAALRATVARREGFGDVVYYFSEIDSTNDVAATFAEHGAPEGTLVVASSQTAGRGRLGRVWHSPTGAGLYASIVCRGGAAAPYLTLAGGLSVAEGITIATGLPVEIKWPNDIVIRSESPVRFRKLAGVLAEGTSGPEGLAYVILGLGINVRSAAYPVELADRATSIEAELGRSVEAESVLAETLVALAANVTRLTRAGPAGVLARWRALAPSSVGSPVEWATPTGRMSGIAAGIADDGALLVRTGEGTERIISGEITWK
jgi:BirA family transcriptional regulator, biotin operon repressor / biotin---[acetyl-CoA-carboxylase] ligase